MKKSAIILVNLGTPESPTAAGVSRFLKLFLSDRRVVEAPRLIWWLLLRLVIIPLRAKKVAHAYRDIWWDEGSPLRVISHRQVAALQELLNKEYKTLAPLVVDAVTYGNPSIAAVIASLKEKGIDQYIVVPMYPQYSGSTTGAIYDQLSDMVKGVRNVPDIHTVKSFYNHPEYIDALALRVREYWEKNGRNKKLLMSFHGIPKEYADKGDPYGEHCMATAAALSEALQLSSSDWSIGFQSRFGPKQWLEPYTDEQLKIWAAEGVESVDVISPAFTADCLETLEELNISYRQVFMDAGGLSYNYIPCVNDSPAFTFALFKLIKPFLEIKGEKIVRVGNFFPDNG